MLVVRTRESSHNGLTFFEFGVTGINQFSFFRVYRTWLKTVLMVTGSVLKNG